MSTTTTTTSPTANGPKAPKDPNAPMDPADYTVIAERLTGTVKWFNNKAGFGFITVCEPGEFDGKDIFVHYSSIRVTNSQYKYLVQGEYVDFTLVKANSDTHEFQAMDISGVKGGPIMCETRRSSFPADAGNAAATPTRRDSGPQRGPRRETRAPRSSGGVAPPPPPSQRSQRPSSEGRPVKETATGEENLGFTKVQKRRRPSKVPTSTSASV